MDYSSKTVTELRKICKERKIKGISRKSKADIVKLLTEETSENVNFESETIPELKEIIGDDTPDSNSENVDTDLNDEEEDCNSEITPEIKGIEISLDDLINKVIYGDCMEMMKKIPENSIDMVCTDPPYFLDGLDGDWNKKRLDNKGSSLVVGNLPKGMRFDRNQSKKFNKFYSKVSSEVYRILKPGGAFISFSSPRLYHSMAMAIENTGFEIRDMLGWIYLKSQVKAFSQDHIIEKDKSLNPEQKTELKDLCHNWKTPQLKPAIEPMCLAVKPIEGRYIDNFQIFGTGLMNTSEETKTGEGYFPSNIITTEEIEEGMDKVFLVPKPNKTEKGVYNTHISVKPVNLVSHLIKLFTKENAIILDPFIGSGTTAVACIQSKRRYIGFDISKEYIKIAKRRIKDCRKEENS
jgi:site-specific DNA-methyltransferase (adenine-specific)